MSTKKSVVDAIVAQLGTITNIGKVITREEAFFETGPQDLPALLITTGPVERTRLSYPDAALLDMQATMQFTIRGRVYGENDAVDTPLDNLIDAVEAKLNENATVLGSARDIFPREDARIVRGDDNHAHFEQEWETMWFYNHTNP